MDRLMELREGVKALLQLREQGDSSLVFCLTVVSTS